MYFFVFCIGDISVSMGFTSFSLHVSGVSVIMKTTPGQTHVQFCKKDIQCVPNLCTLWQSIIMTLYVKERKLFLQRDEQL